MPETKKWTVKPCPASETKRQRDALLVALKWAILHSFDVAECDCKACVEVRAIVAECESGDA